MPFTAATYPLAVRSLESGDRKGALGQVSLNGVLLFALFAPAMAGVALLTPSLVVRLIAAPFRDMTIIILPIAFLVAAIRGLRLHTSEQAMMLLERTRQSMYVAIFEAAANVVFCVIGLRFGGLVGAALGILAGTTAAAVASFAYSFRDWDCPPPARALLRIVLATGMMSASLRLMPEPSTLSAVAAMTAIGAAVYGGVIILVLPECRALVGQLAMRFGHVEPIAKLHGNCPSSELHFRR